MSENTSEEEKAAQGATQRPKPKTHPRVEELERRVNELTEQLELVKQVASRAVDLLADACARIDDMEKVYGKRKPSNTPPASASVPSELFYEPKSPGVRQALGLPPLADTEERRRMERSPYYVSPPGTPNSNRNRNT